MRAILLKSAIRILFVLVVAPIQLYGQAVYGTIVGTVLDASGATVPNAKVIITEVDKDVTFVTSSNESGNYRQTHLIAGRYRVQIEASGFKVYIQEGVTVSVDTATEVDATLQLGEITETIKVTEEIPLLKTERTDVATTINQRAVEELPIFNRNFTQFILLTPGTQQLGWQDDSPENPQGGRQIMVNGQHFAGTGYLLDGTDNRDAMYGNIIINPTLDSISEAKVTSQNYDAEFGQATAGVVASSTKSGTNEFHGSAFLFRRNDLTQARDPFTQSIPIQGTNNQFLPQSLWNQFGGSVGGPIIKNKTFFFADYQGTRRKDGGSVNARVPTAAERTGDLRELAAAGGVDIYDPLSPSGQELNPDDRQQFLGNVIPSSRLSPVALNLLSYIPLPNRLGVSPTDNNYSASGNAFLNGDLFNVRVDHFYSSSLHLFGRYTYSQFKQSGPGAFGELAGGPAFQGIGFAGKGDTRPQSLATGFDYTLSPNLLTDFRFGFYRERIFVRPGGGGTPAQDSGAVGLNFENDPFTLGMPAFYLEGQSGFIFGYSLRNGQCNCPLDEIMQQFQFVNNWSSIRGNHTFKFGGDIRRVHNLRIPSDAHRSGELYFHPERTQGPTGGGLSLATFLLGDVTFMNRYVSNSLDAGERQSRWFFYGQDTWRITPRFTLNYGLRWEIYFPQTVTGPRKGGWLDISTGEMMIAGVDSVPLNGNVQNTFTNLAPRLGMAYQATQKTVIRLGYGRSFDVGTFGSIFGHSVTQNLPVLAIQALNPPNNFESVFNIAQGPPSLDPNTILDSQPRGPNGRPILPDGVTSFVYPNKMRLPTVDSWNATVQHQLTPTLSVETGYVGNKGTHVFTGDGPDYNPNQPTIVGFPELDQNQRKPFFNQFGWSQGLRYFGNDADNNYHSLQTKVEKRFSNSLSFLAHHTWARARNHDGSYFNIDRTLNYGRPDWQRAHVFILSNILELPFGRGKRLLSNASGITNALLGGWQVNANTNWSSGLAVGTSYANCGADKDTGHCRPDRVGSPEISNPNRDHWYGTATDVLANNGDTSGPWGRPAIATFGNDERNSLRGPGFFNADMSFFKNFPISERLRGQFRAEAFNVFNRVNLANPDGCVDCGNAGRIFGLAPNAFMRRWQFAFRLEF